jgi:hypothetical protein
LPQAITLSLSLLPLIFAGYIIVHDILWTLAKRTPSNPISRLVRLMHRPFRDFLRLSDLAEYDPSQLLRVESKQWKRWTGVAFSGVAASCWLVIAIGRFLEKGDSDKGYIKWWSWYALAMSASWVCVIEYDLHVVLTLNRRTYLYEYQPNLCIPPQSEISSSMRPKYSIPSCTY